MLTTRGCGVLLHPTSLPGAGGIGTLGDNARRFIDLLVGMGMSYWQILPLSPPSCGNSPYSAFSAFAGNPLLIDLEQLAREGDLPVGAWGGFFSEGRVEYDRLAEPKMALLRQAAAGFLAGETTPRKRDFWHFCDTTPWLHDYALFMALKQRYKGKPWHKWPADAALLTPAVYESASVELGSEIGAQKYMQWQFFRQWREIRDYANAGGIAVIGDVPIFVAYDSADVWRRRDLFLLDSLGKPTAVAGVPPDYFSKTGQLWGNPLFDWRRHEDEGFSWWIERCAAAFACYDCLRIDHFRGFEAAWHVPAGERTAMRGSWVAGPGERLFRALFAALGQRPIIAEDLGVITPAVEGLRDTFAFPGMKILQFAFGGGGRNPYLPHNHIPNSVVYTGTHDNDTLLGWLRQCDPGQFAALREYLGERGGLDQLAGSLLRHFYMSVARTAIVPLQDLLALGAEARMNVPGTPFGNWEWRFTWEMVTKGLMSETREALERYGRVNHRATSQSA